MGLRVEGSGFRDLGAWGAIGPAMLKPEDLGRACGIEA